MKFNKLENGKEDRLGTRRVSQWNQQILEILSRMRNLVTTMKGELD